MLNVPLATVILNRYTSVTAAELGSATGDVCSPTDTMGFASSGIYLFWDIPKREILYVGLAVNLGLRFAQHNGLSPCPAECCKAKRIADHFSRNSDLGYTVLVQSPLEQPVCAAWASEFRERLELLAEEFGYMDAEEARQVINTPLVLGLRWFEGLLIRAFERKHGHRPFWNGNSGANINYSDGNIVKAQELLKAVTFLKSDYLHLTSHCSMVELSENATHLAFELFLHGARLGAWVGTTLKDAAERIPDPYGLRYWERIKANGYLAKLPRL